MPFESGVKRIIVSSGFRLFIYTERKLQKKLLQAIGILFFKHASSRPNYLRNLMVLIIKWTFICLSSRFSWLFFEYICRFQTLQRSPKPQTYAYISSIVNTYKYQIYIRYIVLLDTTSSHTVFYKNYCKTYAHERQKIIGSCYTTYT